MILYYYEWTFLIKAPIQGTLWFKINVFKSAKYSKEEKEKLKRKGQLESLTMIYEGIK